MKTNSVKNNCVRLQIETAIIVANHKIKKLVSEKYRSKCLDVVLNFLQINVLVYNIHSNISYALPFRLHQKQKKTNKLIKN